MTLTNQPAHFAIRRKIYIYQTNEPIKKYFLIKFALPISQIY